MHLSVIIPSYNEEKRLPKTLEEIDKYLSKQNFDYEIIVVSDGSKDKTGQVVRELYSSIKGLRLIDNKENHGKGYVTRQGMLEAKGDFRLFTDADNSTPIEQIEKMWPYLRNASPEGFERALRPELSGRPSAELPAEEGFDVVIGSRDIKGAVLDPPQPYYRRFTGDAFRLFRQLVCDLWGIKDTQCGFKCFTGKAAADIFPKCLIDRFSFDPEFLILAKKMGYKIKEVPIYWKNDPDSKVKFKSMVKMGLDLLRIRWNLITRKYNFK